MSLPQFPKRAVDYPMYSAETLWRDKEQKQVAQATRAALADWFMEISEPLNSLGKPLPVIDGNGVKI